MYEGPIIRRGEYIIVECTKCGEQRSLKTKSRSNISERCINCRTIDVKPKKKYSLNCEKCGEPRELSYGRFRKIKRGEASNVCRDCHYKNVAEQSRKRDEHDAEKERIRKEKRRIYQQNYRRKTRVSAEGLTLEEHRLAKKAQQIKNAEAKRLKVTKEDKRFEPIKIVDDNYKEFVDKWLETHSPTVIPPRYELEEYQTGEKSSI